MKACRQIFSCVFCSLLLHKTQMRSHKASNYTMLRFNSITANTEYVRTNRLVAAATTSCPTHAHTPVFTHCLTEPGVLHVNRVCCCAEEVLTSSVLHLGRKLICIKGDVKESSKDRKRRRTSEV